MELWSEDRDPKRIKRILEKIENKLGSQLNTSAISMNNSLS